MVRYFDGHGNDVTAYVEGLKEKVEAMMNDKDVAQTLHEANETLKKAKVELDAMEKRAVVAEKQVLKLMSENSKLKAKKEIA